MKNLENIKAMPLSLLQEKLSVMGMKKYRAGQVFEWIYNQGAASFAEMTNISRTERDMLEQNFYLSELFLVKTEQSSDGTMKFLYRLRDGQTIESVLIPDKGRNTLCISSQVGCAQACRFCLTGSGGFQRNLEAFEIADQVLLAEKLLEGAPPDRADLEQAVEEERLSRTGKKISPSESGRTRHITNIVFMGMGEPLANFDNAMQGLKVITNERGLAFSPRRVTVSTDGLVPEIERLGKSGVRVNLAVSLNATTDPVRDRIMPVNRRYPIAELLAACRRFPLEPRRRITFEYVLLKDVNDSPEDAVRLARLLRGLRCKINLIPFNPFPGSVFERPDDAAVRRFQAILLEARFTVPVRESRGRDISAACGQLRAQAAETHEPARRPAK